MCEYRCMTSDEEEAAMLYYAEVEAEYEALEMGCGYHVDLYRGHVCCDSHVNVYNQNIPF